MPYDRRVTPQDGPWDADAVVLDMRRAYIFGIVLNLLIWPGFIALLLFGIIIPDPDWRVRAIASFFLVCCLIPLIALARKWRFLLVPMGFVFDRRGLYYWRGQERGALGWHEIAAVGIGFESPPHIPALTPEALLKEMVQKVTVDKLIKDRRKMALEIFPRTAETWGRAPALHVFRRTLEAPWPDLIGERWQIPLPARPGLAGGITRGAQQFAPGLWRGWFRRPWTGGLIRTR
jgi:hypothetical protein